MTGLLSEFGGLIGDEHVSDAIVDRLAYAHDASPLSLRAARDGIGAYLPDVVAWPRNAHEVSLLIRAARRAKVPIVPYGGGSGIVGGALPVHGGVVVDLKRCADVADLDQLSRYVTVGAGINGQRLEDYLNERGWTTGHYPQSLRSSTVGGWIAHGATGTASTRYGGIERLVSGLEVVLPSGDILKLRPTPRAAAGPDLRMLFVGGEGTLGIVTEATLRIRPVPAVRRWLSFLYPNLTAGLDAVRAAVQADLWPTVARLYDAYETQHQLPGRRSSGESLLILSCEGSRGEVNSLARKLERSLSRAGGSALGPDPGEAWWTNRFNTQRLLATLQLASGVADALEVSAPWSTLGELYGAMRTAMEGAIADANGRGEVYGHASHFYPDGGNLYLIFRAEAQDDSTVPGLYVAILEAAFGACAKLGASYSHHHGIGLVKAPWFSSQQGAVAAHVVRAIKEALDPEGLMNPGKLVAADA